MIRTFPDWPYKWPELLKVCDIINGVVVPFYVGRHRITLDLVFPVQEASGRGAAIHQHSQVEAHLCLAGDAKYTITKTHNLLPGNVIIHPPGITHQWVAGDSGFTCLFFLFTIQPEINIPELQHWPVFPELLWDIAFIIEEGRRGLPGWHHRAAIRLSLVLSRIILVADTLHHDSPSPEGKWLLQSLVDLYLNEHLSQQIRIIDIAETVQMSERSLIREFQRLTGETIITRLLRFRIEKTCMLLQDTDMSLLEIGNRVGIPNTTYLCRVFRHAMNITPIAYRAQYRLKKYIVE
jgi:AraC-like DNA-binding protein